MAKVYTAQEMRIVADNLDSVYVAPECEDKEEQYKFLSLAGMMLRQAADLIEREEKRPKKYEYCDRDKDGFVSPCHSDTLGEAIILQDDDTVLVRRPVGEWEEVKG